MTFHYHDIEKAAARNREHAATLAVGDDVAFTRLFIASGGGHDQASWRGTIIEREGDFCKVEWKRGHGIKPGTQTTVNAFNLCKPRSVSFVE
jgi:hypothetical protein